MQKLSQLILAGLLLVTVSAVGCGGDDTGDGSGSGDPPVASFTFNPDCTMSNSDVITFTSTSTDTEDGSSLECSWLFSNGTPSSSASCTAMVTFPNLNPYNITLTVTDSDGNSNSFSDQIDRCSAAN